MKAEDTGFQNRIEDFICSQVTGRGLDSRTEKAYRQDLENFYTWLEENPVSEAASGEERSWEAKLEIYLDHLSREKQLRPSTITRKYKVFTYYLSYLVKQGVLPGCRPLTREEAAKPPSPVFMSRQEVDALFQAMEREYEDLDSDFRKRVCLRDMVMLELLFYHRIEVSELLRLEVSDYDQKTGVLFLPRKRGKGDFVYVFSRKLREKMARWLQEREYFQQDNEYQNRMFLSKLGRPLSMKMVINVVDKYRKLAGIAKEITPKDLKKSMEQYAKELVMEWCG